MRSVLPTPILGNGPGAVGGISPPLGLFVHGASAPQGSVALRPGLSNLARFGAGRIAGDGNKTDLNIERRQCRVSHSFCAAQEDTIYFLTACP